MIQNEKYESIEVDPTLTEVSFTFSGIYIYIP